MSAFCLIKPVPTIDRISGPNMTIAAGDILIEDGTKLPLPLKLSPACESSGWSSIVGSLTGPRLENTLLTAGRSYFSVAGSIRAKAYGFAKETTGTTALSRLFASARLQNCNCVEIDNVSTASFLGLSSMRIAAHSCQIQPGMVHAK